LFYYLLLLTMPVISCGQYMAQKQYNLKAKTPNAILFSAITAFIALLFFVFTSGFNLQFNLKLIPYSVSYALGYSAAYIATVLAVRYGSMAIASLILSFTLIFPTFYGVLVRGDRLGVIQIIGFVFLFSAMFLSKSHSTSTGKKVSPKWAICVLIAFIGNGVCSIASNMQVDFVAKPAGIDYKHEFMVIALLVSTVLLLICGLISSKNIKSDLICCTKYSSLNGICNAAVNLISLSLIGKIPNTVLYPTSSGLGMIVTFIMCFVIYHERFRKRQYLGYLFGVVSIILLNL